MAQQSIANTADQATSTWHPTRRQVIGVGGVLLVGGGFAWTARRSALNERGLRAGVFIGKAPTYDADLVSVIRAGFDSLGITRNEVRGKRILLKPNLVETAESAPHINTNPAMVVAAAAAFASLGAKEVFVAEGQGHRRDSRLVLDESGMGDALTRSRLHFVDLNHDDVVVTPNKGKWTSLRELHLPRTLVEADWVVSMPKLKTHHWAGVTCAMKNLFGVMPGIVYGWPKNVLHVHGIPESILDINATVKPHLAIVDGIVGMEGDGPIMGPPKACGCVIIGRNPVAVDATAVRVMGLNPYGAKYLTGASGRLGPIHEQNIIQRGERIADVRTHFTVLDVPHLRDIVA